jgi:hypothetical protein
MALQYNIGTVTNILKQPPIENLDFYIKPLKKINQAIRQ